MNKTSEESDKGTMYNELSWTNERERASSEEEDVGKLKSLAISQRKKETYKSTATALIIFSNLRILTGCITAKMHIQLGVEGD